MTNTLLTEQLCYLTLPNFHIISKVYYFLYVFQADNNEPFKDNLDPRLFEFDNSDSVELRTISKW